MGLGTLKIEELGRRAVACKGWRWLPGMLTLPFHEDDDRNLPECHPPWRLTREGVAGPWADDPTWGALPDLTDPATLGCLLALVREVAQEPGLHVRCMLPYAPDMGGKTPPPWVLHSGRGQRWGDRHDTEAEALVAALEAAS